MVAKLLNKIISSKYFLSKNTRDIKFSDLAIKLLNLQHKIGYDMDLRIREILSQQGKTLKDLSQMSGISQSNLSNYINGNISPTLDTIKKIAVALNVTITELFVEKEEIELYAKYKGNFYQISKKDILNVIEKKKL